VGHRDNGGLSVVCIARVCNTVATHLMSERDLSFMSGLLIGAGFVIAVSGDFLLGNGIIVIGGLLLRRADDHDFSKS